MQHTFTQAIWEFSLDSGQVTNCRGDIRLIYGITRDELIRDIDSRLKFIKKSTYSDNSIFKSPTFENGYFLLIREFENERRCITERLFREGNTIICYVNGEECIPTTWASQLTLETETAVVLFDEDNAIIYANNSFETLFPSYSIENRSLNSLFANLKSTSVGLKGEELVSYLKEFEYDLLVESNKKTTLFYRAFTHTHENYPGFYLLQVTDITNFEQKREIYERKAKEIDLIFQSTPVGIFAIDDKGRFNDCNDYFISLLGSSREKLTQRNILEGSNSEVVEQLKKALNGEPGFFQGMYQSYTGTKTLPIRAHFSPIIGSDKSIRGCVGIVEDYTHSYYKDKRIKELNVLQNAILESNPDYIFTIDNNFKYILFNRSHFDIIKQIFKVEIKAGDSIIDITKEKYPRFSPFFKNLVSRSLKEGLVKDELELKDGDLHLVFQLYFYSITLENETIGTTVIARDITKERIVELENLRSKQLLQSITSNLTQAFYRSTSDNGVIFCNQSFADLMGYSSPEELYKQPVKKLYYNIEDREEFLKAIHDIGKVVNREVQFKKQDGSLIWGLMNTKKVVSQDGTAFFDGVITDITEKKLIEEKTKKNEQLLKSINANINEGVYRSDADMNNLLYINKSFARIFGYEHRSDVYELKLSNLYASKEETERVTELFKNNKQLRNEEIHLKRRDGSTFWGLISAMRVEENNKQVYDGAIIDISDKKAAEERLKHSEERYRTLFDNNPSMYFTLDVNGNILEVNKYGAHQMGYEPKDLIGLTYISIVHNKDRHFIERQLVEILGDTGINRNWEYRIINKNSGTSWVRQISRKLEDNDGEIKILMVCENITDRKEMEEALLMSEESYRGIFEYSTDAIYILNTEFKFIDVNQTACNMYGYPRRYFIGLTPRDLGAPGLNDDEQSLQQLREALTGKEVRFEYWGRRSGGAYFPKNVRLKRGSYFGETVIFAFAEDITGQKLREDERNKLISSLTRQNRDLQQFSNIISHNLRAPVANILSLTSIFDFPDIDQQSHDRLIEGLKTSATNLDETIKDLNEILTIQNDVHDIKETIVLKEVVSAVNTSLSRQIASSKTEIRFTSKEVKKIYSIKSYIHSIFFNLISNSIKYRKNDDNPVINISACKINGAIELRFEDNGIGIDLTRYKKELFKLYRRFHVHVDGKGLGLYMVKSQVETLGGTISIDSEVDRGTTFIITLPDESTKNQ